MPPKNAPVAPRDMVLAKMPGFPAWPLFVMPDDLVPPHILKARKNAASRCVIFIPDGDFYWISDKNLEPLTADKLDSRLDKVPQAKRKPRRKGGRTNNVIDAFVAAQNLAFDDFMETLRSSDKSEGSDGNEEEGVKSEDDKSQDQQNESQHEKSDAKESPASGDARAARAEHRVIEPRRTRSRRENGALKPDKDRQHQLWMFRIKLQRLLIQRNQPATPASTAQLPPPTVDELLVARIILHRLADFPVSVELLRQTKIHKVLKCILKDVELEYPDSFRLHEKCEELLDKWRDMVDSLKLEKRASRASSQVPEEDSEDIV